MTKNPPPNIYVPTACTDSDGNRIYKDAKGHWINLARCALITKEQKDDGCIEYCDQIRANDDCPRGFK